MNSKNETSKNHNLITTLFIDVYGVLHEGGELFEGVKETLEKYKKNHKIIIISNTTPENFEVIKSLSKKGLEQTIHYDDVITSGDVFIDEIRNDKSLIFTLYTKYQPFEKYFIPETSEITKAENIYIGIPKNEKGEDIKLSDILEEGQDIMDLIKNKETKFNFIEKFIENLKGKKVYCANSDVVVVEQGNIVIRQGFIGLYLQNRNIEVKFFGKPYRNIFEKAMKKYNLEPKEILMIGDQYSTDLGCNALGINTALVHSKVTNLTKNVKYFNNKICIPNIEMAHISELELYLNENFSK